MKILIYAMNYAPEVAGVGRYTGDIAQELVRLGHQVRVVTTPPHYPGWQVQSGWRNRRYGAKDEGGAYVIRCPLLLRARMRGIWRVLASLSFALSSLPIILWQMVRYRPDIMLCVEPTLLAAPVVVLFAPLLRIKTVLHVQDLEIDAAIAVGHIPDNPLLRRILAWFELMIMRQFCQVITISERMRTQIISKGIAEDRVHVVRNWVDLDALALGDAPALRAELTATLSLPEDAFIVLYSGNMGAKQGLEAVIAAAHSLKDIPRLRILLAGEGPEKTALQTAAKGLDGVIFLPFQRLEQFGAFLRMADLHLLPQAIGINDLVLPSKLGGLLASGKPLCVMAELETELAEFLTGIAHIIPPGDAQGLASAIRAVYDKKEDGLTSMRQENIRQEKAQFFSHHEGLKAFMRVLFKA